MAVLALGQWPPARAHAHVSRPPVPGTALCCLPPRRRSIEARMVVALPASGSRAGWSALAVALVGNALAPSAATTSTAAAARARQRVPVCRKQTAGSPALAAAHAAQSSRGRGRGHAEQAPWHRPATAACSGALIQSFFLCLHAVMSLMCG